jgi:hypothetical protein
MNWWKMVALWGGFLSFSFAIVIGMYYLKSRMGVDVLKDRHFLIFPQAPKLHQSFKAATLENRSAEEQNEKMTRVSL